MAVDDVEAAIDLVAGLAGRATGERHDYDAGAVVVMTDPEGHEFCLVQYYSEASALAAPRLIVSYESDLVRRLARSASCPRPILRP